MKSNESVVNRVFKTPGSRIHNKLKTLTHQEVLYLCQRLAEFTQICNKNDITLTVRETMNYIEDTIYCLLHERECHSCPPANGKIEAGDDWSLAALWGSAFKGRATTGDTLENKVAESVDKRLKRYWMKEWGRSCSKSISKTYR